MSVTIATSDRVNRTAGKTVTVRTPQRKMRMGIGSEDESSQGEHEQDERRRQDADKPMKKASDPDDTKDPDDADSEPLIGEAEGENATSASATLPLTGDTLTIPVHPKLAALLAGRCGLRIADKESDASHVLRLWRSTFNSSFRASMQRNFCPPCLWTIC